MNLNVDVIQVLEELVRTAANFEAKAVKHQKVQQDRQALRDALTRAQLILSLLKNTRKSSGADTVRKDERLEKDGSKTYTTLRAIKGGKEQRPKRQRKF